MKKIKKIKKNASLKTQSTEKILSVNITTLSRSKILKLIALRARQNKQTVIFTPNPQILLEADRCKNAELLNLATLNIPDGVGIAIASKIKGGRIQCRVSGIDLAESILAISEKMGYRVFLLGARRGVAKVAKQKIKERYPHIKICGTHHGYFDKFGKENKRVVRAIKGARPDVIFVCFGYPAQEKWIIKNAPDLPSVKIFIGLGGSLDVWSGKTKRAPTVFKALGIEWLYRTVTEPHRIRIFWDIPAFLFRVLRTKNNE